MARISHPIRSWRFGNRWYRRDCELIRPRDRRRVSGLPGNLLCERNAHRKARARAQGKGGPARHPTWQRGGGPRRGRGGPGKHRASYFWRCDLVAGSSIVMARFTCCVRGLVCHLGTFMVHPATDMGMAIVNGWRVLELSIAQPPKARTAKASSARGIFTRGGG